MARVFLVDILVAISKIKRKTSNLSFEDFVSSDDYIDIVLRNLSVIGEAVGQLLKDSSFLVGMDVEWRKIVNLRNVLIHFYFGIDLKEVYRITQKNVPQLEEDIIAFIKSKKDRGQFLQALNDAKSDLADEFRRESIAYLEKIESLLKTD